MTAAKPKPEPELAISPLRAICNLPDGDLDSSEIAGREEEAVRSGQCGSSGVDGDGSEQGGPSHERGSGRESESLDDVEGEREKKKRTKL